jgi:hypothetical protein
MNVDRSVLNNNNRLCGSGMYFSSVAVYLPTPATSVVSYSQRICWGGIGDRKKLPKWTWTGVCWTTTIDCVDPGCILAVLLSTCPPLQQVSSHIRKGFAVEDRWPWKLPKITGTRVCWTTTIYCYGSGMYFSSVADGCSPSCLPAHPCNKCRLIFAKDLLW